IYVEFTCVTFGMPHTESVLFVINVYVTRRDLLSFPTRRSSDLRTSGCPFVVAMTLMSPSRRAARGFRSIGGTRRCACPRSSRARSEEHTSELQSREKLVCRLLLEKKK